MEKGIRSSFGKEALQPVSTSGSLHSATEILLAELGSKVASCFQHSHSGARKLNHKAEPKETQIKIRMGPPTHPGLFCSEFTARSAGHQSTCSRAVRG